MEFSELVFTLLIAWSLRAWLKISWIWGFNFFRMLTIYSIFCVDADFDGQICYCECWLSAPFFCVMLTSILKKCPKRGECWLRPPPHPYPHIFSKLLWYSCGWNYVRSFVPKWHKASDVIPATIVSLWLKWKHSSWDFCESGNSQWSDFSNLDIKTFYAIFKHFKNSWPISTGIAP